MMMNFFRWAANLGLAGVCIASCAQTVNATQQVTLEGLQTVTNHGGFSAAAFEPDGSLITLINQHDGLRLQKTDAAATTVLATAHAGAAGDAGIAMALDPSGNIYVVGTTTSGMLTGTSGVTYTAAADTSTNSFLAKYDANLNLVFLTFLGAGKTSAMGVAATADAAFVTGVTYSATFPVTASGIQQAPASGTLGNGFVERFSGAGTLVYSTYLTGIGGDTTAAAIAADATDAAYVVGTTAATGFPTISGLVPQMLGTTSGFALKLTAAGDGITWSTFVPGTGLTSAVVDAASGTLVLTGNVSLGQFPVPTVTAPLAATSYQVLLRLAEDGQSVVAGEVLAPGTQSFASVGTGGDVWISGALSTPLFPTGAQPVYGLGDSFALHLTKTGVLDQTSRFGGVPADNAAYATVTTTAGPMAISTNGAVFPATLTEAVNYALLTKVAFDVPLVNAPNTVLPSATQNVVAACTSGQCSGTAGLLAGLSTTTSGAQLALSTGDAPNITVRNLGSATATGIAITATGFTVSATSCGPTLDVSAQCVVALSGNGPGSVSVSAANAATATASLPANTLTADPLALSTYEMDFGIAAGGAVSRTITVTNLTASTQTFASGLDHAATTTYKFAESASTCGGPATAHTLAANTSCTITISLTPSTTSTNDGAARVNWLIGTRDVVLTGFAQAATLGVSATEVDFGVQYSGATALRVPRYLYLSNSSASALAHAAVTLGATSAFTAKDECPSTLESNTVCRITLGYASNVAPSKDAVTLTIDGVNVLLTGTTLQPTAVTGSAANPSLSVTPASLVFGSAVVVTGVSGTTQTVTVKNTGTSAMALSIAIKGDFTLQNGCGTTLNGGASCALVVGFAPSQPGTRQGLLAITGGNGFAPTYVTLSGTGTAIFPSNNGSVDLGQTYVGQPLVQWFKISQSLTTLTATSTNTAFGVVVVEDTGSGHGTPAANAFLASATSTCANCWVGVQFASSTVGTQSTGLALSSVTGGNAYNVTLTATALPVAGLLLTPVTQDFGPVAVNSSSAPITFTLANLASGSATAQIQSVTTTGDFTIAANTTGGPSCQGALGSTAACFVQLVFAPTATGARTGTLTVVTNLGIVTASLTGYGLADPGIALNPSALVFADVPGTAATMGTVAVSNTGTSAVVVGTVSTTGTGFAASSTCGTLATGAMCAVTVTLVPQSATASGVLSVPVVSTLNGQTSTTTYQVPLSSTYTSANTGLQILPNLANFGALSTSTLGLTRQFTLENFSAKTMSIALAIPRQFPLADPGSCATLAAGASCGFSVSFLPSVAGEVTGTVTATGTPTDGSAVVNALAYMIGYGQGSGALTVTGNLIPYSPLSFGQVTSGQTAKQILTLTNSGTSALTVRRVTALPPYYATTTCGAALAVSSSCTVTITYAPVNEILSSSTHTLPRVDTGTVTIESDAVASPYTEALTGTVAPVVSSNPASSSVLNALSLSQGALTFSNTVVGSVSAAQTVTLTNTGTTTVHVSSITAPVDFTATTACGTLTVGQSCTVSLAFSPTTASTSSVRSGTLEVSSDAGTSLEFVTLLGASSAAPLTLSPVTLDFGTLNVSATSPALSVTVTNTSATPITLGTITTTGDYTATRGTCPASGSTLAAGSSCAVSATFTPTGTGTRAGVLSLSSDATQVPLTVTLTGIGAAAKLTVTPSALAFGSIVIGTSLSETVTLLNSGTIAVTGISLAITGTNAADFAVTGPCSITTLAAGQGCSVVVTYTPSIVGTEAATLTVVSSDPNSPATVALSGTGVATAGSFLFTVNGGSAGSAIVASGAPATYALSLIPVNGFTGTVALTCAPVVAAQYAACSLLPSTVVLSGAQVNSTATITTITTITTAMLRNVGGSILTLCLLLPWRRKRRSVACLLTTLIAIAGITMMQACGGSSTTTTVNNGPTNLKYAPAGTYQYTVTASSTTGAKVSQTVTLNLTIH